MELAGGVGRVIFEVMRNNMNAIKGMVVCCMMVCITAFSIYAATRTWSSSGSTDMNLETNYSGSGALLTTDDLVFDATSVVNATATASLSVNSITRAAAYSGNTSWANYVVTVAGNLTIDGAGTLNVGSGIISNGASATIHIGAGVGAISQTICILTINGTTGVTLDFDKAFSASRVVTGANSVVTWGGDAVVTLDAGSNAITTGVASTFTIAKTLAIYNLTGGNIWSIGTGASLVISGGATYLTMRAYAGTDVTIPATTVTGTGIIQLITYANNAVVKLTGNQNYGTMSFNLATYTSAGMSSTINLNNYNITCGALSIGNGLAGATGTLNCGSGTITATSVTGAAYNAGTFNFNMQTSVWSVAGSWTFGSTHTVTPGTSRVTITNTSTITSNSKNFYDFAINAATKTITLADALSVHDYTMTAGTLAGAFTTTCSGNVLASASTTFNRLILTKAATRTVTMAAGATLTLTNLTNTNVNGSTGALTQWRSGTDGIPFNLVIPAVITLTHQNPRNCTVDDSVYCLDGTSVDGGGNTKWVFPASSATSRRGFSTWRTFRQWVGW